MRAVPPPPDAARPSLRGVAEGVRYARSRPELLGTYLVDINAMFFGMPNALFPASPRRYGGPGVLGLLYTAPAVGSLVATVTRGWTVRVHRHGLAVLWAAGLWGVAILGFGLAPATCGSPCSASRWPGPPTWSAACSAWRSGTRPSPTTCAAGSPASS